MSLEKKLKQLAIMKDVKLETDYVQLGKALRELGVVAQKIREKIQYWEKESISTGRWLVADELKRVLGLLVEEEKP